MNSPHMSRVSNIAPLMLGVFALSALLTVALFWSMLR